MPVTLNAPPVTKLPPVMLPVATTKPAVPRLPTLALPVALNAPTVVRFPPDTFPVAATVRDAVTVVKLPVFAVVAPTVPLCAPNVGALTLPAPILPVTVNAVNVPVLVMLG